MNKKYSYIELIADEAFKEWVLAPNKERTIFWEARLKHDEALKQEAKKAREFILRLKREQAFLQETEKEVMLQNIISPQSEKRTAESLASRQSSAIFFSSTLTKVAAVLLLLIAVGFAINAYLLKYPTLNKEQVESKLVVKRNEKGRKSKLTLPDGSKLNVNANSELSFAEDFNSSEVRTVYLKGEAFFDVEKMQGKPFKVITGSTEVTVLGTSFNVNTGSSTHLQSIAVKTGKVAVNLGNQQVLLLPNEVATVQNGRLIKSFGIDEDKVFGWKEGMLVFDNEDFEEVIQKLENWYGVAFSVEGQRKGLIEFSGKYQNKTLEQILDGLSFAAGFDFSIKGKEVKIMFN